MHKAQVKITNPCHLKWSNLTPLENSRDRHCHECSLNIIDFTGMTQNEILNYLAERKGQKVCCAMLSDEGKSNKIQTTVKSWRSRINSGVKNHYSKSLLLFLIGILITTTGCKGDDDDFIIGEPIQPDEMELATNPETILTDSTLVKINKQNTGF